MALDPKTLDSLMILVCAVALVSLVALIIYTWVKWHQRQLNPPPSPSSEPHPLGIELTGMKPVTHFQKGYLNEVGRESPNLSGSRTFLNDDVLKQKPFPKDTTPPPEFQTKDVVYHANAERNPNEPLAGDIVYHANGPFDHHINTSAPSGVDVGHVVYNANEPIHGEKQRALSESMARTPSDSDPVSHRKNTYL